MRHTPLLPLRQDFLERLSAVRALAYPFFRGAHPRSAFSGAPAEFDGHRPYVPGDDIRWIDWNLFARMEEYYVKVFQVEEEVEVLLLVDESLSMNAGGAGKFPVAAAAAAALAHLAIVTSHPVTVVRYADLALDRRGPYRHPGSLADLGEFLLAPPRGRGTDLMQSILPFLAHRRRPLVAVAVTDGFQKDPLERTAAALGRLPQGRFVLLRVTEEADLAPRLRGTVRLDDVEGEEHRLLLSDRSLERQLRGRIRKYVASLEENLKRMGAECVSLPAEGDFEEGFLKMLLHSVPASEGASRT